MISKDTVAYISIAARPSNFGTTLFNAAFRQVGLNAIYQAFKVNPGELAGAIAGIRSLDIKGCGVSMPFKQLVIKYLDRVDATARKIGAVNTIVNKRGRLVGYNTDYEGALAVLKKIRGLSQSQVLLLGDGGVAQAIACALAKLKPAAVYVASREARTGRALVNKWRLAGWIPWNNRASVPSHLLINATPIGMAPRAQAMPIPATSLDKFTTVLDVVLSPPETALLRAARKRGLKILWGYEMSLHQAMQQFSLYTGKPAPRRVMERAMKSLW